MSFQTFLASDMPIKAVDNPHVKLLSVNEAIEMKLSLPDWALASSSVDPYKPGVILWCDSEENMGEITIRDEEKANLGRADRPLETQMQYFSSLEWRYTKERAQKLIEYIKEHLQKAAEIEVWNLWVGDEEAVSKMRRRSVSLDRLQAGDFEKMFWNGQMEEDWQKYECLVIVYPNTPNPSQT